MARAISKKSLLEALAQETGHTQKDCSAFLTHLAEIVTKRIVAGDAVALPLIGQSQTAAQGLPTVLRVLRGSMTKNTEHTI